MATPRTRHSHRHFSDRLKHDDQIVGIYKGVDVLLRVIDYVDNTTIKAVVVGPNSEEDLPSDLDIDDIVAIDHAQILIKIFLEH
jgi:hypothetical protein